MRIFTALVAMATFSFACNALAVDQSVAANEVALTGLWQEGLTSNLRLLPQEKLLKIHTGNVLVFSADHTFRLYPKCGREKIDWEKRGVGYLGGSWKLTTANQLHIVMEAMGKKIERDVEIASKGDDLIFISPSNPKEQFGKFAGTAPQQCSAQ